MDYPIRLADQLREHLRALRKKRGLTQTQLGRKLGLGQARIAEIESQPGLVSVDQLLRLMAELGATLVVREAEVDAATKTKANTTTVPPARKKGSW
jgi:HTH-type transcriptional regulator / antitoxin HipB